MHNGLNFNNLKYFYDAVETSSISESARRNFITQSAVSQGIQKLEKALAMPLITHQRNCFKLTAQGEQVFSLTQQILRTLQSIADVSKENTHVIQGQINVVCTQSIAVNLISSILQSLKKDYPKITINMKIGKLDTVFLMLKRGVMDIGLVVESNRCDEFEKHVVRQGFFKVFNKKASEVTIDDGVYVDHANGLFVDKLQRNYEKVNKKELKILQELDSWQVLAKCAENGIGACFLPDFILQENESMSADDSLPPIPYRIVAIHPKGVQLTLAAKKFLAALS